MFRESLLTLSSKSSTCVSICKKESCLSISKNNNTKIRLQVFLSLLKKSGRSQLRQGFKWEEDQQGSKNDSRFRFSVERILRGYFKNNNWRKTGKSSEKFRWNIMMPFFRKNNSWMKNVGNIIEQWIKHGFAVILIYFHSKCNSVLMMIHSSEEDVKAKLGSDQRNENTSLNGDAGKKKSRPSNSSEGREKLNAVEWSLMEFNAVEMQLKCSWMQINQSHLILILFIRFHRRPRQR